MKPIIVSLLVLFLVLGAVAEENRAPSTLRVGKDLTYKRGTARAKEQLLEFPYYHAKSGDREYRAFVVHEKNCLRVIFKKDEVEGKKDDSGDLINQDFPLDHPFQKTLDVIKLDAFLNVYEEQKEAKELEKGDWQILSHGAAVHKKFFKDSENRYYAIAAVYDPDRETISQPIMMSFQRSRQGPMAWVLTEQGTLWGRPQPVSPQHNLATNEVFDFVESRQGF